MNNQSSSAITPSYAWYSVGVLFVVSIFAYMDRLLMGFLIVPIQQELMLNDTQMGLISGLAFATTYVLMGIPLGRLVDRVNRSYVLAVCVALWSIATCLCGFTVGFISLFLMRVGVGIGEAGLHPAAVSIIGDLFPEKKVSAPMSVFVMGGSIGGGLAIIGGAALIAVFNSMGSVSWAGFTDMSAWRLVFVSVGLPGLIVAAVVWFTVRDPGRRKSPQLDAGNGTTVKDVLDYFRKHSSLFLFTLGGFVVHAFYSYGWHTWVPAMLSRGHDATADDIGLYYGVGYLVCAVLGALSVGPLMRFFERRGYIDAPVRVPLILLAVMILPAVFGPVLPSFSLCILSLCIMIYCYAAIVSISLVAIVRITPSTMRGLTSGIFIGVMNITGGAFGAVVVGLLSDYVFGSENIGYALAVEGAITLPFAFWLFLKALPHYRAFVLGKGTDNDEKFVAGVPADS